MYIGSWDNNVHIYSIDRSRLIDTIYCHDDAVSSLCVVDDVLATGSWDTTVKVSDTGLYASDIPVVEM